MVGLRVVPGGGPREVDVSYERVTPVEPSPGNGMQICSLETHPACQHAGCVDIFPRTIPKGMVLETIPESPLEIVSRPDSGRARLSSVDKKIRQSAPDVSVEHIVNQALWKEHFEQRIVNAALQTELFSQSTL